MKLNNTNDNNTTTKQKTKLTKIIIAIMLLIIAIVAINFFHKKQIGNKAQGALKVESKFKANNNTIKDEANDLEWMRCSLGQKWTGKTCQNEAKKYSLQQAKKIAKYKSYANHNDWRLPTIKELNSLIYCSNGKQIQHLQDGYNIMITEGRRGCLSNSKGLYKSPTINQQLFPNTSSFIYWSSTPFSYLSNQSWAVDFNEGYDGQDSRSYHGHVRLVRVGQ